MSIKTNHISPLVLTTSIFVMGLVAIIYSILSQSWSMIIAASISPFLFLLLIQTFKNPFIGLCSAFTFNYFFILCYRYTQADGLSLWYDILTVFLFLVILINIFYNNNETWKYQKNIFTIGGIVWAIYTAIEIVNPTASTEAWIYSRGVIYSTFLVSFISVSIIVSAKQLRIILYMLSVFTLTAVAKAAYQKYYGFDAIETQMLIDTEMYKTHLLSDVTRYFSFFTDAGNFGSNMGFTSILFGFSAIFVKNKSLKIYYIIVAALSMYALFISGTRGALFVPISGVILFTFLSKNVKLMAATVFFGLCFYVFFAHTFIGEGNPSIRRMRTAFKPTEDASYLVRQENKRVLASYLRNKPFGEGLGLGGVEGQKYGTRLTTIIPHDSFYVKLWMETGIVGLILYLTIYLSTLLWGCYLIMFHIKDKELRGMLTGIACGIFGLMVSTYGNAFFGQFPTGFMVILFLSILLNGKYLDQQLTDELNLKKKMLNINRNNSSNKHE